VTGRSLPLGVTFASLQGAVAPDNAVAVARRAADLGYRSFWTAEVVGPEAFVLLGSVAAQVPSLDVGTGVVALQLRTPPLLAMAAATLQTLIPDRDVLVGIGISSPVVAGRWHGAGYGDRPLAQVREFVTLLRACLSGESVDFEGDFYKVSRFRLGIRLGEHRPKIVIGALNEGMLRLAGEVADGVLLDSVTDPDVVRRARELVGPERHVAAYTPIEPTLGAGAVQDWIADLERAGADTVILQATEEHLDHFPLIAHLAGDVG
jgi:alkanesulfonate monooxygenase SsuD/methylene tetrahydromethanopterin reductase-like flavin-dependent oxidoreductase (luciferase family)